MDEMIRKLKEVEAFLMDLAKSYRKLEQELSYALFKDAETVAKAADMLKRNTPQEMETEGGGTTWWYVCPECHGAVDRKDSVCRHCGQALKG